METEKELTFIDDLKLMTIVMVPVAAIAIVATEMLPGVFL